VELDQAAMNDVQIGVIAGFDENAVFAVSATVEGDPHPSSICELPRLLAEQQSGEPQGEHVFADAFRTGEEKGVRHAAVGPSALQARLGGRLMLDVRELHVKSPR